MTEVIYCILMAAFAVNGIEIATGKGMILELPKLWLHSKIGNRKIYKPIIGCVKCMPSVYGAIICVCFLPFTLQLLYIIPVVILCSSTLATIINQFYI